MRRFALFLATAGGAGLAPVAPGTFGSAVGIVIYCILANQSIGKMILAKKFSIDDQVAHGQAVLKWLDEK